MNGDKGDGLSHFLSPSDQDAGENHGLSAAALEFAAEVEAMFAIGIRRAQEEARRAGVPCVYSINGVLHWELPDGSLTTVDPWQGKPATPAD